MQRQTVHRSFAAMFLLGALILFQGGPEAAPIFVAGGGVERVVTISETVANIYTPGGANPAPGTFVNLPGAAVTLSVPPNSSRLFVVTFSAESACYDTGAAASWCPVRILIGGVEGNPAAGTDFAFDGANAGVDDAASWEGHSMQRSRRVVNSGTTALAVPIVVQRTTNAATTTLRLDDWHVTINQHF